MTLAEVDALLAENGALCGIAYLGDTEKGLAVGAPSLLAVGGYNWKYPFLGSIPGSQMVEHHGYEVYALIPRSDVVLTVRNYYYSLDYNFVESMGDVITSSTGGTPLIVRCNVRYTLPNMILVMQCGGVTKTYIPRSGIDTGELLLTSDAVMDLTIYEPVG